MSDRAAYMDFRTRVMDYQDMMYEQYNGETPSHILLSERMWNFLSESHKFEQLQHTDEDGFLGMRVWKCGALDKHEKDALLLSDSAFRTIATL